MKTVRIVSLLFLAALAIDAARVAAQQTGSPASGPPPVTDPLAKELERCKALNEKAASDPSCEDAYKNSRERFFQPPPAYQSPPPRVDTNVPEPKLIKPDQTGSK